MAIATRVKTADNVYINN